MYLVTLHHCLGLTDVRVAKLTCYSGTCLEGRGCSEPFSSGVPSAVAPDSSARLDHETFFVMLAIVAPGSSVPWLPLIYFINFSCGCLTVHCYSSSASHDHHVTLVRIVWRAKHIRVRRAGCWEMYFFVLFIKQKMCHWIRFTLLTVPCNFILNKNQLDSHILSARFFDTVVAKYKFIIIIHDLYIAFFYSKSLYKSRLQFKQQTKIKWI